MLYVKYFKNNINLLINNFNVTLLLLNSLINVHHKCLSFCLNNFINEINEINDIDEYCNIIVYKN